jgi:lysophospholipase L1-like esterase
MSWGQKIDVQLGPDGRPEYYVMGQKLTGSSDVTSTTDPVTGGIRVVGAGPINPLNTVILIGDSITANNTASGAAYSYTMNNGCFTWANAFMGQKLSVVANLGLGGQWVTGASGMAANIASNLATYQSDYVVLLGGTNDISNNVSAADLITGYKTIINAVIADGRVLLLSTNLPRAASTFSGGQQAIFFQVNAWLREVAVRYRGVIVSDPFRALADPTSASSGPITTDMYDGVLHPSASAAMKVGAQWAADWGPFIPPAHRQFCGAGDVYDATNNPYGNMLANGLLQTLGATSGTGYAGNNPSLGYVLQRVAGTGTWTGSAVARTDLNGNQGNWYRAAITGETLSTASFELRQGLPGPNSGSGTTYAIGDQLFAEAEIKVTHTGTTNYVKAIHLVVTEYDRSNTQVFLVRAIGQYTAAATGGGATLQTAKDYTIIARTPVFTSIGSSGSGSDASQRLSVAIDVLFDGTVSGSLTVDIGHISIRKVVPTI